jgi:anti-sigma factor RsiW
LGIFPNSCFLRGGEQIVHPPESPELRSFAHLARLLQSDRHLRNDPQARLKRRENTMTHQSTLANKLAAAASAFVLSLVLISGTVSMPSTAQAQTVYVGEIA